jgi:hypothetical protein
MTRVAASVENELPPLVPVAARRGVVEPVRERLEPGGHEARPEIVARLDLHAEHRTRGGVHRGHPALAIDGYDGGRKLRHQGFDIPAAFVQRLIRATQIGRAAGDHLAALLKLSRHVIERVHELADLVADVRENAHA